jgi:hypothetical protein
LRGLFLKTTLNLLNWILRHRSGNSLIIGGPLGWSWQATLDASHHGSLVGPADAHRHSDLANIGIDDHHARDHATRHQLGGADQVSLDTSQIGSGRFGMARMPDGPSGQVLTAQGAGVDPAYADALGIPSGVIAMWHGLIANIPSGYVICDGNNSTPNLLARFVQGVATAATNPGATGGSPTHSHDGHPAQSHSGTDVASHASYSHTTAGAHTHDAHTQGFCGDSGRSMLTGPVTHASAGGHTHNAHPIQTHSVTQPNAHPELSHSLANNEPEYYDVAFIMKT